MKIKSPKDFWAGLMFIGFGGFFMIWALTHYQMGSAVRMGPAYFPAVLGGLLALLGVLIIAIRPNFTLPTGLLFRNRV